MNLTAGGGREKIGQRLVSAGDALTRRSLPGRPDPRRPPCLAVRPHEYSTGIIFAPDPVDAGKATNQYVKVSDMSERRVGLWLIGAFGGVATTAALGLAALRRGLT